MTDMSTRHIQRLLAESAPGPWIFREEIADTISGTQEIGHEVYAEENHLFSIWDDPVTDEYPGNLPLAADAPELAQEVIRLREELIGWANDEALAHNSLVKQAPEAGGAVWYLPYHIGDIRRTGEHIVAFGHDCQDKPFRLVLTEDETETIARTLLAAAKHQEEE